MNCKSKTPDTALTAIFDFTDIEVDALRGFIPMTKELFNACMERCDQIGLPADAVFFKLVREYPDYVKEYLESHDMLYDEEDEE